MMMGILRKSECFSISQYGKERAMIKELGSEVGVEAFGEMGDWWGEVVESGAGMGVCGEGGLRTALSQFPVSQKFNNHLSTHSPPLSSTFRTYFRPILFHSQPFPLSFSTTFFHFLPLFVPIFLSTSSPIPLHHFMFYYLTYSPYEISVLLLTRIMRTHVYVCACIHAYA